MSKIVLREKVYIPIHDITDHKDQLDENFIIDLFKEANCEDCEERDNRPTEVCEECANYLARKKLYNVKTVKGTEYVGLPYGKRTIIANLFPEVKNMGVTDMRPYLEFRTGLKFTGLPRDYQEKAINFLADLSYEGKLRGILVAPARSGKTILSVALSCKMGQRTLVLVNQHFLAKQFYETCMGGDSQPAMTNAPHILKSTGKRAVVMADCIEDFLEGDIVISTYQKFISEVGAERLKEISSSFTLLIVDETHRANSNSFLKVVATLNTVHKLGLTATVTRKDGLDVLCQYVLGKVLYKVKIETLVPKVVFHETGLFPKKDYSSWVYYCRWLERNEDRTDMIIDQVMQDLKNKRHIVIPCGFTSQIDELVRRINYMYGRKVAVGIKGATSKKGKAANDAALEDARSGKVRVIVGTSSIIGTGTNVPLWDTYYWTTPVSNPPNWVQLYSRILTPLEGKDPIIRMFLDGSSQTRGCLRTCLFKTEGDTPTLAKAANITPEMWKVANAYIRSGKMSEKVNNGEKIVKTAKGRISL